MYYGMTSIDSMFFLLFFFNTKGCFFMSTDGLESMPPNNMRLLGRRNWCLVDNIIEGPSVKGGIFEVPILLTSHLAHQS